MKKFFASLLALAMCLSLSCSAFASDSQSPTNRAWDGPPLPELYENATYWYQNDTIWNGKSTNSFHFRLDADFQYAKIWIDNQSGGPIIVATSYEGDEFGDSYTIQDGKSKTIYVKGNGNEGAYSVDVTADQGHTLDGTISLKSGTKSGVGYPW